MALVEIQSMPGEMKNMYERLHQEIYKLHAKWKIFRQLYSAGEKQITLLRNTAPGFFRLTQLALLDDVLISIGRITDPGKSRDNRNNVSIEGLVGHIKKMADVDKGEAYANFYTKAQTVASETTTHCKAIRKHRNRRIAHSDFDTALGRAPEPLPSVEGKEIDDALRMIASFMNMVQGFYNDPPTMYDHVLIQGDGDALVSFLSQAVEYIELKYSSPRR